MHKTLRDAELWKQLLRSAATLGSFTSINHEVINYSLTEASARASAPVDVDQMYLVNGKWQEQGQGG